MIIIFSGYNQRAVIAFLRTLEKNGVNNYGIVASSNRDSILMTSYASKVRYIREHKELCFEEILYIIKEMRGNSSEQCLLIPSTEALNRFFLQNRELLEKHNCLIPLVDQKMYELVSDKEAFWEYCQKRGLQVPEMVELRESNIPFVAKPKQYYGKDGKSYSPIIVKTAAEYAEFVDRYNKEDFMYQEYVWGESFYLLFYFERNGAVYRLSQVNYMQQPAGKSIVMAACSDLHLKHPIVDLYEKLFLDMGYYGFVMVELRRREDAYYMIEANPRFWGPSQLFCNAKYNLFEVFLKEYGYIEKYSLENVDYHAKYLWSGGIVGDLLENQDCVWFNNGKEEAKKYMKEYLASDIYNYGDTKAIYEKEKANNELVKILRDLYMKESKHSNYQILSAKLQEFLGKDLVINSRYEKERLQYIIDNLEIKNKKILDIGGNTGFFTLESCDRGAQMVDYFEGNKNHAQFVYYASKLLEVEEKIVVHPEYYTFSQCDEKYDIIYCLNVVHHLGSDFAEGTTIQEAKQLMMNCVNQMASATKYLVFQMGYNWCGNPSECLFEHGTKEEMEQFVKDETAQYWDIVKIAVAQKKDAEIEYEDINEENNVRKDSLGEFLNRPLFIMKSKVFAEE